MSLQASNLDLQLYFVELNFFKLQLHVHSTIAKTYTCAKCCEQLDPGYMKKKAFIMATTVLSQEILGSNAADSSREGFRRLGYRFSPLNLFYRYSTIRTHQMC